MFGICIESSHERGMGHLFRQLNFASFLTEKKEPFIFFVNDNPAALKVLSSAKGPHEVVPLNDYTSEWEKKLIKKHRITTWIDDRLDTDSRHAQLVKDSGVRLVVFDDYGSGAPFADFNFSALFMGKTPQAPITGKVYTGTDYLILNRDIDTFKRRRSKMDKLLVTLGGSDTYGVTLKVAAILNAIGQKATIILGPSFEHHNELKMFATSLFEIKSAVTSMAAEMAHYDLAICGGGMTPFEANASGLPCVIIAHETFEIPNGQYLEGLGSSVFAGYHEKMNKKVITDMAALDLPKMSQVGLAKLDTKGAERIWQVLSGE